MLIGEQIKNKLNLDYPLVGQSRIFKTNEDKKHFSIIMESILDAESVKYLGYQSARHYFDLMILQGYNQICNIKKGCVNETFLTDKQKTKQIKIPKKLLSYVKYAIYFSNPLDSVWQVDYSVCVQRK